MQYIAHNIKFYRERNKLLQQEIADKLEITVGMVKQYERDNAVPQIETLIAIADMMKISLDKLVRVKLTEKNYSTPEEKNVKILPGIEDWMKRIDRKLEVLTAKK